MNNTLKALFFLIIITVLDFLFRQGFIGTLIPIPKSLPLNSAILILYTVFTVSTYYCTKIFAKKDNMSLAELGISYDRDNRLEFFYGLLVGIIIWAIVSFIQSYSAGFSWELRHNLSLINVLYGLIFIFVADLGTELYTRGYPLTKLKDHFTENIAIIIMVFFVSLKSISFDANAELLFYIIVIPAIHTIFFSIIYFKTKRLGAAVGLHTGANFITISIFDLRIENANQAIPSGLFQSNINLDSASLSSLHLPWVIVAALFSLLCYFWWKKPFLK